MDDKTRMDTEEQVSKNLQINASYNQFESETKIESNSPSK